MPFLRLERLSKAYGMVRAVDRLDLDIKRGEFVSLLGPSGCGKTTTLQMIAGFVEPTGGRVILDGVDLATVAPNARDLGIVFQNYALFPHMTAAENIAFGLEMRKVPPAKIRKRVADTLAMVGLADKGDRYPRQMSGGQQQRVALARALVIGPKALLLDEPLSNLDAKLREEMQIELRQIQTTLGITAILVTHDQQEALALSDRIVVMNSGRAEQIGEPFLVYERPATPFVAHFLGKNNSFLGEGRGGRLYIAGHAIGHHAPSGPLVVNLRSEKIRLVPEAASGLPGRIVSRIFQGNHWLFRVKTPAGLATVLRQNDGTAPPREGETVALTWNAADSLVRQENGGELPPRDDEASDAVWTGEEELVRA
jgi:putative spermidine/putrescine transport system ATP-binding protein